MTHSKKRNTYLIYSLSLLFFCLLTNCLVAQSRQDLTKKRQRLIAEIDKASRLLSAKKKDKAAALDNYYTIQRQVQQRQQLITTLNQEIKLSNESIIRTSSTIAALQEDMERLEAEYTKMARQAYRNKMNDEQLLFLFSAEGFSDGLKRWRYIQQYDDYRKKQANLILETRSSLTDKLNAIEVKKAEQQDLLAAAEKQQGLLEKELNIKNSILKGLTADESRISQLINKKRKAHRQLSKAIERIISNEINSRPTADRLNTAPTKRTASGSVPKKSTKNIAANTIAFKGQKGKLTWPVLNGLITRHFGKQTHPIHKQVMITNNGIDIQATNSNRVMSIYGGEVAGSQYVPGYQYTLIIQHGNYYSVYSNLEKVVIKKGDKVRQGQLIGIAGVNSQNDFTEVHLEIWKGKQRLNPSVWLAK